MKFDWKLALARWVKGAVTGALAGFGAMQIGEATMRGVAVLAIAGLLSAVVTDLDAYLKARGREQK